MLQKAMRKLLPVLFASLFLISFGFLSVSAEDLNPDDSFDDQQSSAVDYPEPTDARWPFTPTDPEPTDPVPSDVSFLLTDNFNWGKAYVYAWDADGNAICGE